MDERQLKQLQQALDSPAQSAVAASGQQVGSWFAETAPLIQWEVMESPLGPLYLAASPRGLCALNFGVGQASFLERLDPLAQTAHSRTALAPIVEQLQEYFAGTRRQFDLPLDLERLKPFQLSVLQTARRIPAGSVWTYGQMARTVGKPGASRAVGQALGRNPLPIVIPCHRVVASDGGLGGYSGGGGLASKRWLLHLEGAL